jgi:uncharacterized protein
VSGLLLVPEQSLACLVFAHGDGAGMTHPFMTAVAEGLADRRIATINVSYAILPYGIMGI